MFSAPVQQAAWQAIASGEHALVIAPTGSGKTLAAFLTAIDTLFQIASACSPLAIACHAACCTGVGAAKVAENQRRVADENRAKTASDWDFDIILTVSRA